MKCIGTCNFNYIANNIELVVHICISIYNTMFSNLSAVRIFVKKFETFCHHICDEKCEFSYYPSMRIQRLTASDKFHLSNQNHLTHPLQRMLFALSCFLF